jgi:hypothetical protein
MAHYARQLRQADKAKWSDNVGLLLCPYASGGWGGKRKPPMVFTEHGAVMAASVLNSPRAVQVSVYVVRAFMALREALATHKEIGRRVDELERKVGTHDRAITQILQAIRELAAPPPPARRRIGFI